MNAVLLFLVPLAPLLLAMALLRWPGLARWSALSLVPALAVLILVPEGSGARYGWWLLGSQLGLDRTAFVFLCFTLLLWLAAALALNNELETARRTRFNFCFLLTMSGNLGVVLAQDAVTFYLYFALMSFASYGLVIERGDREAHHSGLVYLAAIMAGEVALFVAFVILDGHAGCISFELLDNTRIPDGALLLLLFGFGIKSGVLLLHVWMPLVYSAAPIAAAVVLAGAMVKTGLLGWLRFFPLGWEGAPLWGWLFLVLGFAGAFYGVLMGMLQRSPRVILAYSSVSQMGLLTALVGLGLMAPQQWPQLLTVTLIYAAHHALVKGALFMGLGVLGGAGLRPWLLAAYVIVALAMAGAPLLSGAVAKLAYKTGAKEVLHLELLLSLSALATALLMARLLDCLRYLPRADASVGRGPWVLLLGALLAWPWLWPTAREHLLDGLSAAHLFSALWPILAAGVAYGLFVALRRVVPGAADVTVPPGDLLLVYGAALRGLGRLAHILCAALERRATALFGSWRDMAREMGRWLRVGEFEKLLLRWEMAWAIYLGLMVAVLLALII